MLVTADILRGSTGQQIGNLITFFGFLLLSFGFCVWAWREWRERGRPALAVLVIGGLLANLGDAPARWLLQLYPSAEANHPVVYRAFDVAIAPWMMTAFVPFVASAGYVTWLALADRWPRARFCGWFGGLVALDFVGELVWINVTDTYGYDKQPLAILNLSLVWPFAYMTCSAIAGALVFYLGRNLDGARQLLLVPIPASIMPGLMVVCAWPTLTAMRSGIDGLLFALVGVVTIASMLSILYAMTTQMGSERAERSGEMRWSRSRMGDSMSRNADRLRSTR